MWSLQCKEHLAVLYVYSESASSEVLSRFGVISSQVLGYLKSSWEAGYSQQEQSIDYTNKMWWDTWELALFHKELGETCQTHWRLIVRVMSHYKESSGGSCSEQDREGEKQRRND